LGVIVLLRVDSLIGPHPTVFTPWGTPQAAAAFAATPQHLQETLLAHGKARCGCPETGSASGGGMMLMHLNAHSSILAQFLNMLEYQSHAKSKFL
jgi:hypothetical protein